MILSVTCECFTASECSMERALYQVYITQNKMVRNYSTDNATLSFMQIKQSSGIL